MDGSLKFALDVSKASDFREALAAARAAGMDGVTTSAARLGVRELSQTGRREVRAMLARHALAGAALRADLASKGLTAGADADRIISELHEAMVAARDCGFAIVACDLGTLPRAEHVATPPRKPVDPAAAGLIVLPNPTEFEESTAPAPPPLSAPERRHAAFAAEVLREAGQRADRVGVPVAFGASLATTADLVSLLASAACPLFGRELDPAAVLEEGPSNAVAIEPAILHVRGRDAHGGSRGKTRPAWLGEGDADWPGLLSALRDADYHGFISIEAPPAEAARASRRLRGMK